jgi:hypothetical protein
MCIYQNMNTDYPKVAKGILVLGNEAAVIKLSLSWLLAITTILFIAVYLAIIVYRSAQIIFPENIISSSTRREAEKVYPHREIFSYILSGKGSTIAISLLFHFQTLSILPYIPQIRA